MKRKPPAVRWCWAKEPGAPERRAERDAAAARYVASGGRVHTPVIRVWPRKNRPVWYGETCTAWECPCGDTACMPTPRSDSEYIRSLAVEHALGADRAEERRILARWARYCRAVASSTAGYAMAREGTLRDMDGQRVSPLRWAVDLGFRRAWTVPGVVDPLVRVRGETVDIPVSRLPGREVGELKARISIAWPPGRGGVDVGWGSMMDSLSQGD